MPFNTIPIWKEAPFVRITIPFIAGIITERAFTIPGIVYWMLNAGCVFGLIYFGGLHLSARFAHYRMAGALANLLLVSLGGLCTSTNNNNPGTHPVAVQTVKATVLVTLDEPLTEKNKTYKALATLDYISGDPAKHKAREKIILYFQKDTCLARIAFPSGILFRQPLREISNSGNPGAFDFKKYCAMQRIYHQVYLKHGTFIIVPAQGNRVFEKYMYAIRTKVIGILRTYIPGKLEAGLAEALLIGYKNDLDKNLLQTYAQTGVVHVIAISGLHLGLIYWILHSICLLMGKKSKMRIPRALVVISGLWLFTLVAGGAPSITRSAVMFTFIAIGASRGKKVAVYNSLALSAFVLLGYNPYWLADTGFQLSYVAVLSIVIFMKPVYNWFFIKNRILDQTWKLTATTIAAQILTTPVIIYYFNQFPNYFLLTNLVAIPLSSLVILAEISLSVLSFHPVPAMAMGHVVFKLINMMNAFVGHMGNMPFATMDNLRLTTLQLVFAYIIIMAAAFWLLQKNSKAFFIMLLSIGCFSVSKIISGFNTRSQQLLIVYNTPDLLLTEFIVAEKSFFICDTGKIQDNNIQNFVLRPAYNHFAINNRILLPYQNGVNGYYFCNKRVLIINQPVKMVENSKSLNIDMLIVSGKQKINAELLQAINCNQVIMDSTVPLRTVTQWKEYCLQKGIPFYAVAENGAFILNLN